MILFDLDGTLTDSGPGITRCVQYALASFGIEEPDLEKLNCYVGPPLLESFMNFAGLGCEEAQQAITKYRERYEAEGIFENEVYGGIPEVLAYLKEQGKILAVASSKPEKYVEQILEHFEIRKYFTVVTGSEMNETRTDKGEVIAETLRRLGAEDSRSDVVMVGDRSYDVIGARENGLLCVGVSYGYGGREELEAAGAAKVCDTPEELKLLAEDPKEEKKRRDRIKKNEAGAYPVADKRRKWNRNLCAEREKSREYKRKKDSENRAKNGGNRNSYPAEAMASFKTASDVRTVSDRSNRTSGADPDDVYDRRLSGRAYARDIRSCISNRQSGGDPGSLETVQKR